MKGDINNTYTVNRKTGVITFTTKAYDVYYTGTAKLNKSAGDTFDETKGKRIAKLRAIMKMKRALLKENLQFQEFIHKINAMEEEIQTKIQLLTESYYRLEQKLNDEIK